MGGDSGSSSTGQPTSPPVSVVPGIGKKRSEQLHQKGIDYVSGIIHPADTIAQETGYTPRQIRVWQSSALSDPDITHAAAPVSSTSSGGS